MTIFPWNTLPSRLSATMLLKHYAVNSAQDCLLILTFCIWFWVFGQSTQGNTVVTIFIMQNFINLLKFCIIQSSIKIKIINNFLRFPWFGFSRALGMFVPKLPALVTSDWKKEKTKINEQEMFLVRKKRHLWKLDRNEHFCNPRKFELSAAGCS